MITGKAMIEMNEDHALNGLLWEVIQLFKYLNQKKDDKIKIADIIRKIIFINFIPL